MKFNLNQVAAKIHQTSVQLDETLAHYGIVPQNGMLSTEQLMFLTQCIRLENQNKQESAEKVLECLVRDYVPMIDTNQLLDDAFPMFMSHLIPSLKRYGKALIVPQCVVRELHRLNVKKPELREKIDELLPQLCALQKEELVTVYGDTDDNFADQSILETVLHYMTKCNLLVITKDRALSTDIISQKQFGSIQHKKNVLVERISRYGYLSKFNPNYDPSRSSTGIASTRPVAELISDRKILLQVDEIPGTGDSVEDSSGQSWELMAQISSGGEGTVYDLGDGTVAKIYRRNRLTEVRRDKLELMVGTMINCPGICWPSEILYNRAHQMVGYRMEKAGGVELASVLLSASAFMGHFPEWNKADTVQLSLAILRMVCALHKRGILLGDINLHNILVEAPGKVWFVDCDSYQIGGYPCPVGTVCFTPPEIQGRDYGSFLRTEGNENFALASLLFMVMVPGMRPYTQLGGADAAEQIREMNFPYPCGDRHSRNVPMGACRYIWSHLPRFLKEAFYETFQKDGDHSTEQTRFSAAEWMKKFQYYDQLIRQGKIADPESMKIFPIRRKAADPDSLKVCATGICEDCGEHFEVTLGEMRFRTENGRGLPRFCPRCREGHRLMAEGVFEDVI